MRAVRIDHSRRTVHVEGGATWADVDAVTQPLGLATPGGVVSETGVAGLALSGGVSSQRRLHGMTIDNLVSAEIVLADGRQVHASADEHPDLHWAIRGGGGNFGVVTSFELRLHELGPEVFGAQRRLPGRGRRARARRLARRGRRRAGRAHQRGLHLDVPGHPRPARAPARACPTSASPAMYAGDRRGGRAAHAPPARARDAAARHERHDRLPRHAALARRRTSRRACATTGRRSTSTTSRTPRSSRPSPGATRRPSDRTLVVIRHGGGAIARVGRRGDGVRRPQLGVDAEHRLDLGRPGRRRAQHRLDARLLGRRAPLLAAGKTYFNFPGLLEEGDVGRARELRRQPRPAGADQGRRTTRRTSSGSTRTSAPRPDLTHAGSTTSTIWWRFPPSHPIQEPP